MPTTLGEGIGIVAFAQPKEATQVASSLFSLTSGKSWAQIPGDERFFFFDMPAVCRSLDSFSGDYIPL